MAMAISQPTINLQPLGTDDSMEITSDSGHIDGDIEIDYDQYSENTLYLEDEQMLEDAKSDAGAVDTTVETATHENDDIMADGSVNENMEDDDLTLHDDATLVQEQDEELLDFTEEGDDDQAHELEDADLVTNTDEPKDTMPPQEYIDFEEDEILHQADGSGHGSHPVTEQPVEDDPELNNIQDPSFVQEAETSRQGIEIETKVMPSHSPSYFATQDVSEPESQLVATETEEVVPSTALEAGQEAIEEAHALTNLRDESLHHGLSKKTGQAPLDDHTDIVHDDNHSQVFTEHKPADSDHHTGTPTMTGLHPAIVQYQGAEVSLFPSSDPSSSEEYFLQDENLVNGSISDMLQACRDVLGETITEDEELRLGVDDLGLYMSEDSTSAFSTSFAEILDIYVRLHVNDGVETPSPMYITLSRRTKFANRLTLLTHAVAEGKGLSKVPIVAELSYRDEEDDEEESEEGDEHEGEENDVDSGGDQDVEDEGEQQIDDKVKDDADAAAQAAHISKTVADGTYAFGVDASASAPQEGSMSTAVVDNISDDDDDDDEINIPSNEEMAAHSSNALDSATDASDQPNHEQEETAQIDSTSLETQEQQEIDAGADQDSGNIEQKGDKHFSTTDYNASTVAEPAIDSLEKEQSHPGRVQHGRDDEIYYDDDDDLIEDQVEPMIKATAERDEASKSNDIAAKAEHDKDGAESDNDSSVSEHSHKQSDRASVQEPATITDDFDEIDYDDSDYSAEPAKIPVNDGIKASSLKRSWSEHAEAHGEDTGDSKRPRSSQDSDSVNIV